MDRDNFETLSTDNCESIVLNLKRERDFELNENDRDKKKRKLGDASEGTNNNNDYDLGNVRFGESSDSGEGGAEGEVLQVNQLVTDGVVLKSEGISSHGEEGDLGDNKCLKSEASELADKDGSDAAECIGHNDDDNDYDDDDDDEGPVEILTDIGRDRTLGEKFSTTCSRNSRRIDPLRHTTLVDESVTTSNDEDQSPDNLCHLVARKATTKNKKLNKVSEEFETVRLSSRTRRNADDIQETEDEMLTRYRRWVMKTYSDQTKTKTVTEKKYRRIVETLQGKIPQCTENSKFRFWIRSRGFRIGGVAPNDGEQLYVATKKGYKKVAVVERFWEIIRGVHLVKGKNATSHAGQKKTYSAIRESYAFLPRLAVTKYLLGCLECYKRSYESSGQNNADDQSLTPVETNNIIESVAAVTTKQSQNKITIIKNIKTESWSSNEAETGLKDSCDYRKPHLETFETIDKKTNSSKSDQFSDDDSKPTTQEQHFDTGRLNTDPSLENHGNSKTSALEIQNQSVIESSSRLEASLTLNDTAPIDLCLKKSHHLPSSDNDAEDASSTTHSKHDKLFIEKVNYDTQSRLSRRDSHSNILHTDSHSKGTRHVHFGSGCFDPVTKDSKTNSATTNTHDNPINSVICSSRSYNNNNKTDCYQNKVSDDVNELDANKTPKDDEVTDNTITTTQNVYSFTRSKRKQSPYTISRHGIDSTIEISIPPIKKIDTSSSSGCESTISRSSDLSSSLSGEISSIGDSSLECLDLSPDSRHHNWVKPVPSHALCRKLAPVIQVSTQRGKMRIPFLLPQRDDCLQASSAAYQSLQRSCDQGAPLGQADSTPISRSQCNASRRIVTEDQEDCSCRRLDADAHGNKECRATSPEPHDHDDESFPGRNGEMREELSPGEEIWPGYVANKKGTPPGPRELSSPVILQDTGSVHDETSSSGNKEDDDDDDEDVDDLKTVPHDPERLKAFNMFVRLFVDENLDRIVPISKQPKEKIQAIIDSCTRQFPEFAERARKRIRTYLKSCRRNKRTRDPSNYPESVRPTPAHLTSVQAEQILAQACENESHNAKRMRLGLEPVSQPMPIIPGSEPVTTRATGMDHHQFSPIDTKVTPSAIINNNNNNNNNKSDSPVMGHKAEHVQTGHQHLMNSQSISPMNGSVTSASVNASPLFRPNFASSAAYPRTTPVSAAQPSAQFPGAPLFGSTPFGSPAAMMTNGPTDLSMKPSKPLLSHRLNPTEMAAVRQLITGYRESAAFLLRSADELEQLLLQQP